jgi:hypothetical protein
VVKDGKHFSVSVGLEIGIVIFSLQIKEKNEKGKKKRMTLTFSQFLLLKFLCNPSIV